MRPSLPLPLTAVVLLLGGAATAHAAPTPEAIAERCSSTPPRATFAPSEAADLQAIARCALTELRKAEPGRPATPRDARLEAAAKRGLAIAASRPAGASTTRRVRAEVLERLDRSCDGRPAVRTALASSAGSGNARTPLDVVRFVSEVAGRKGTAPLLGRRTRVTAVAKAGQGGIVLLVAGGTCTAGG